MHVHKLLLYMYVHVRALKQGTDAAAPQDYGGASVVPRPSYAWKSGHKTMVGLVSFESESFPDSHTCGCLGMRLWRG